MEKLVQIIELARELTLVRIVTLALSGLAGIALLYLYEHRDTAVPQLLAGNAAMGAIVIGVVLLIGARLMQWVVVRLKAFEDTMHEQLRTCESESAKLRRDVRHLQKWQDRIVGHLEALNQSIPEVSAYGEEELK